MRGALQPSRPTAAAVLRTVLALGCVLAAIGHPVAATDPPDRLDTDGLPGGPTAGEPTKIPDGNVSIGAVGVPERVVTGSDYEVSVELESSLDEPVVVTVTYRAGGSVVARRNVSVAPAGTKVTLNGTAPDGPGSIHHRITVGDREWTGSTDVVEPARVVVTHLGPGRAVTHHPAGEPIDVVASIRNDGGVRATRRVRLFADGERLLNRTVTLDPGERRSFSRTVVPESNVRYGAMELTLRVGDRTVTGSVSLISTATETPTETRARATTSTPAGEPGGADETTREDRGVVSPDTPSTTTDESETGGGTTAAEGGSDAGQGASGPGFGVTSSAP